MHHPLFLGVIVKAYIAFSIHGTNAFITATKTFTSKDLMENLDPQFKIVKSRREDYDPVKDGVKLEWSELAVPETITDALGKQTVMRPMRSPMMIVGKFKLLEAQGWKVDKQAFVKRHWKKAASVRTSK
jgi:hypothetical protein